MLQVSSQSAEFTAAEGHCVKSGKYDLILYLGLRKGNPI